MASHKVNLRIKGDTSINTNIEDKIVVKDSHLLMIYENVKSSKKPTTAYLKL